MKRKRVRKIIKKVIAILTADWHIRPNKPISRIDNFFLAMETKIKFIFKLAVKYNVPIIIAGDLGNKPLNNGWPTWLLNWFIALWHESGKPEILLVAGQHDLPNHNLSRWKESGIGVLHEAGIIKFLDKVTAFKYFILYPFPFGKKLRDVKMVEKEIKIQKGLQIAVAHQYVYSGKVPKWEKELGSSATNLLKNHDCYDLILTGDNHKQFTKTINGRSLVNAGSLMRSTAIQTDHTPAIYLWHEYNSIKKVLLPVQDDVLDLEHLEIKKEKDNRYDEYIKSIKTGYETGLSFKKNLKEHLKINKTKKGVKQKIWKAYPEK